MGEARPRRRGVDVRQDVRVRHRIVVEDALAWRDGIIEGFRDEGRVCEQLLQLFGNTPNPA